MEELLDRQVPRFDEPGDWDDVLRRARQRRRPRRRLLAVAVAVVAAFIVAPALAVLLRDRGGQLPSGADRSNVVVMLQPTTLGGKQVRLTVRHFGGRINATFFLVSNRFSLLRLVVL